MNVWRATALAALAATSLSACGGHYPAGWLLVTGVTAHQATVVWTGVADARVRCRARGVPAVQAEGRAGPRGLHTARLEELRPGTTYTCRVAVPALAPAHRVRFRTAPEGDLPLRFAVVGDTGDASRETWALAHEIHRFRPAFVLHLGDLAYPDGNTRQFDRRFFRPLRRLLASVPIFPAPGNHDLTGRRVYRDLFAQAAGDGVGDEAWGPRYSFEWGAAHFVALSSVTVGEGPRAVAAWLTADLRRARARPWRIVFLHEPPYSAGHKWTTAGLRRHLAPVFERERADLVLSGHQHFYERSLFACEHDPTAHVLYVTSGGGGANLDPVRVHPNFARAASRTHHVRITVTHDALVVRAVALGGETVDHVRLARGDRPACLQDGWPKPRSKRR